MLREPREEEDEDSTDEEDLFTNLLPYWRLTDNTDKNVLL